MERQASETSVQRRQFSHALPESGILRRYVGAKSTVSLTQLEKKGTVGVPG
jgi:hypothetical protein